MLREKKEEGMGITPSSEEGGIVGRILCQSPPLMDVFILIGE